MNYAASTLPPRTLTDVEQAKLLKVTGEHARGYRDHVLIATSLGTGLREHELLALNVGDIFNDDGKARRRIQLRVFKKSNDDVSSQQVFLPDALRAKLEKFYRWKKRRGESLAGGAPLFVSRNANRLSDRQLRHLFAQWQKRAGFDRRLSFHALRHTCLTTLYRRTRDLRVVQRAARHRSIMSTAIYTHIGDQQLLEALREQPC